MSILLLFIFIKRSFLVIFYIFSIRLLSISPVSLIPSETSTLPGNCFISSGNLRHFMQNERIPKKALLRALLGIRSFCTYTFLYTVCLFVSQESRLHFSATSPAVSVLFVRISGQRDHSAPVLSRRHRTPLPVPGSPRYSACSSSLPPVRKIFCHMRVTFVHTDAFHIHLFRLIAGCCPGRSGLPLRQTETFDAYFR